MLEDSLDREGDCYRHDSCYKAKFNTRMIFLLSCLSLCIFPFATLAATRIFKQWYGIFVGVVLMILAIQFHRIGKKRPWGYVVGCILNFIGNGLSVSALYLCREIELHLVPLLTAILPAVGILLVFFLLSHFSRIPKRPLCVAAVILNIVLLVASVVLWIRCGDMPFSFGFFSLLISLIFFFVFSATVEGTSGSVFRYISFGSFGVWIILTVVVLVILSDGELLDGFDGLFGSGGNKAKKK